MSSYDWKGNVLTIDLEDGGAPIVLDADKLSDDVNAKARRFGLQTKVRNFTAGKGDDPTKFRKAAEDGVAQLLRGDWGQEQQKAAQLSDAEKEKVVSDFIVGLKRMGGDKRSDTDIMSAFNGLPDAQKAGILKKYERAINKKLKEALKLKRGKGTEDESLKF